MVLIVTNVFHVHRTAVNKSVKIVRLFYFQISLTEGNTARTQTLPFRINTRKELKNIATTSYNTSKLLSLNTAR
jgi:hypothetical protein